MKTTDKILVNHVNPLLAIKNLQVIKNRTLWIGIFLFLTFTFGLYLIQFSTPDLVGNDGYYHIKTAYILRTEGLLPDFDWLPLTVLNSQDYYDHHYLYHILLIPFTFGDLYVGAKIASILFPALAFVSIWWLLKKQHVEFAELWSIGLLIISEAFLYRMNMPRAQSLSLLILVWALHWMLQEQYRKLLPLGFIYVWSYNAFPLLLIAAFVYTAAYLLIKKTIRWQPVIYSLAGILLGLTVNPYFPKNLLFIYRHLVPKLVDATSVSVGSEWFPYKTTTLIENSGGALLLFVIGILALGLSERKMNVSTATNLFMAIIFGFMLFQSRRFIEYTPPFILIFAALSWSPLIRNWRESRHHNTQNKNPLSNSTGANGNPVFIYALVLIMLIPLLWMNLSASRKVLQESARPYQQYAEASTWLRSNTPPQSRVFQTDWDDFPKLFFYNDHNTYTLGLDPTYMQLYDADLYDLWVDISEGKVENPSNEIVELFGAEYIFTDLNHDNFIQVAREDPKIILVHEDEYAMIFQIIQ